MKNLKLYVAVAALVVTGQLCAVDAQPNQYQIFNTAHEQNQKLITAHEKNRKLISDARDQQRKIEFAYWSAKYPKCKAYLDGLSAFIDAQKDEGYKTDPDYVKAQQIIDAQDAIIDKDWEIAFPSKHASTSTAVLVSTTTPDLTTSTKK